MEEAKVNVTWKGQNGDLVDPVAYDSSDADILRFATEAIQNGNIPGITADPTAELKDFVVDRFAATADRNFNSIQVRPKTPFGY